MFILIIAVGICSYYNYLPSYKIIYIYIPFRHFAKTLDPWDSWQLREKRKACAGVENVTGTRPWNFRFANMLGLPMLENVRNLRFANCFPFQCLPSIEPSCVSMEHAVYLPWNFGYSDHC